MPPSISELTRRFLAGPGVEAACGPVEPYDVLSAFRVEPRTAWQETLAVLTFLGVKPAQAKMPRVWSDHVRQQTPQRFIPMALGYFPQMVSELSRFLDKKADSKATFAADELISEVASNTHLTINEAAVEQWRQGETSQAIATWSKLPESPLKSFNLGMAHLACGHADVAIPQLSIASKELPAESGWKALADLYRALAESEV